MQYRVRLRLLVGGCACLTMMTLAAMGCTNKTDDTASGGQSAPSASKAVPANAPPEVAKSIQGSQDMGRAMQENANKNGDAMAKAKLP